MKTCSKCQTPKPFSDFYANARYTGGYQSWCKECVKHSSREGRKRRKAVDPMLDRKYKLRSLYGLELDDFDRMLEEQDGLCLICGEHMDAPYVDHCHDSNEVRGLLCNTCNLLLGHAKDDVRRLERAIAYLG